jgi:hypothetical protein
MTTEAELLAQIADIENRARPFREKREGISSKIEALKTEARGLSTQILEIEDESIPLSVQLEVLRKRGGRLMKPKPL